MQKTTKRLLSWLLVLCMVIGMLPVTALAANEDENIPLIAGETQEVTAGLENNEPVVPSEPIPGDETSVEEPAEFEESVESEDGVTPEEPTGTAGEIGYLPDEGSADAIGEEREESGDDFAIPSNGELQEVHFDDSVNVNVPVMFAEGNEADNEVTRYTVLLLDCSGSMRNTPIVKMRVAAIKFCEQVLQANGTNYVAIVPFSDYIKEITGFSNDFDTLKAAVNRFSATGGTDINSVLMKADELLSSIPDSAQTIKNVLLLSDGLPENGASSTTGRYTAAYSSTLYYKYANVCYDTAVEMHAKYNVFTLGFFHSLTGQTLEFGQRFMYDLQNKGYYEVIDPNDLEFTFGEIADDMINPEKVLERKFSFPGQKKYDIEETCYYSDSYFFRDAREYKADLATMSLCLELSSFARENESYNGSTTAGWTTDVTEADARFKNARDLLLGRDDLSNVSEEDKEKGYYAGLGFENFDVNDFWETKPTKDSIGAVAASKLLTDPDGNAYTLIALAVRGGGYQQEWSSNFTVGKTGDHDGFAEARKNVLEFLKRYIHDYQITGNIKLWLVGYSRAGVTANMVAGALADDPSLLPNVTLAQRDLYAYTFEAPQGALRENFQDASNYTNIHNIINLNDLVPLVAPSSWGFARYNSDEKLPSAYTYGSNFGAIQGKMLRNYDNIKDTETYKIQEYVTQSRMKVEWKSVWGPLGYPNFYTEDYEVATEQMLLDSTTFLFDGAVGGRTIYYYDFQAGVREILSLVYGGSLTDLLGEGISAEEFLTRFFDELTFERLWEILSPMVAFNWDSYETRKDKVKENIENFVKDVLGDSDLWGTVMFVAGLKDTLCDLLWRTLESTVDSLWENKNTSTLQSIGNLIGLIAGGNLFQAHYPEVTLAWMMARDNNYGGDPNQTQPNSYRIIRINCPVDVSVYENGRLVAQISDNERADISGSYIPAYVNGDGEKIVLLPADTDYTISIRATDAGEVHYSVEEYNLDTMSIVRVLKYETVEVEKGDILTASVPVFSQTEQDDGIPTGSTVTYTLSDNGRPIDYTDTVGTPAEYTVEISTEATASIHGLVSGGGLYTEGSFAQVEAYPLTDNNFAGWYDEEGVLVSKEESYRFAVTQDTTLVAHFDEVETYQLTVMAQNGGSVANAYQIHVPAGVQVAMEATANTGYTFAGWVSDGGFFEDRLSMNTQFTMPAQNVVVTANFNGTVSESTPDYNYGYNGTSSSHSTPSYNITVSSVVGGMVKVSSTSAKKSAIVTLTVTPDAGYQLDKLTVTDNKENELTLTDKGNGKYTFTMPDSAVTVDAAFKQIIEPPADSSGSGWANPFDDVATDAWYYDAVKFVSENGLMNGTGNSLFEPNANLSRAMLAQILYNKEGQPAVTSNGTFTDVTSDAWYANAINWATVNGIVGGYGNGLFGPNDNITREQLAVMLWRYAGEPMSICEISFNDSDQISDFAQAAIRWAVENGILNGKGNNILDPKGFATRAEVAQMLKNYLK